MQVQADKHIQINYNLKHCCKYLNILMQTPFYYSFIENLMSAT